MATVKQRRAAEAYIANGGNGAKALRDANYDESTVINSHKVTKSKGFIEVLEEAGITDVKLSKVMDEGLGATRAVVMGTKSDESFVDIQPDYAVRHKYLETAIKVKGHISSEKDYGATTYNTFIQNNHLNPNTPEAKELVDATLEMLMSKTKRSDGQGDS